MGGLALLVWERAAELAGKLTSLPSRETDAAVSSPYSSSRCLFVKLKVSRLLCFPHFTSFTILTYYISYLSSLLGLACVAA